MGIDLEFGICPPESLNSLTDRISSINGGLFEFIWSSRSETVISAQHLLKTHF